MPTDKKNPCAPEHQQRRRTYEAPRIEEVLQFETVALAGCGMSDPDTPTCSGNLQNS